MFSSIFDFLNNFSRFKSFFFFFFVISRFFFRLTKMVVFDLKEKCEYKIAEYINKGIITSGHVKDVDSSNAIFEECLRTLLPENAENAKRLKNMVNANEVTYLGSEINQVFIGLIYDQNLESLTLGNMSGYTLFHKGKETGIEESDDEQSDYDDDEDLPFQYETYHIDIIETLQRFLNPTSRRMLQNLRFNGTDMIFTPGWIEKLSKLLPNLKSLEIPWCKLGDKEFQSLCNIFPRLTSLDVSNSRITTLKGISKIKNLEYVDISYINFKERKHIDDMFRLKKIKELTVHSGEKRLKTMNLYMDCGKVLPKLEVLDIAGTRFNQEQLDRLVASHKKLTQISLVGTDIEKTAPLRYPDRDIEVLKTTTIEDCCQSLDFYLSFDVLPDPPIQHIHDILYEKVDKRFDDIRGPVRFSLFEFLLTTGPEHYFNRMRTLCAMAKGDRLDRLFPEKHIHALIRNLVANGWTISEFNLETMTDQQKEFLKIIWSFFGNEQIYRIEQGNEKPPVVLSDEITTKIRGLAADVLSTPLPKDLKLDEEVVSSCLRISMSKTIPGDIPAPRDLLEDFFSNALRNVEDLFFDELRQDPKEVDAFETLLDHLADRFAISPEMLTQPPATESLQCVKWLFKLIEDFESNVVVREKMLVGMLSILRNRADDVWKTFFKRNHFMQLTYQLYRKEPAIQEKVIHILSFLYTYFNGLNEESKDEQKLLVADIQKSVEKYKETLKSGLLDGFSWILTHCKRVKTEKMVQWFFETVHRLYKPKNQILVDLDEVVEVGKVEKVKEEDSDFEYDSDDFEDSNDEEEPDKESSDGRVPVDETKGSLVEMLDRYFLEAAAAGQ